MVYQWKVGTYSKVPAQVAGEICENLEQNGGLTPARLVDVSRAEDAPLHPLFEWNDGVAAEKYRETQAAQMIRFLSVKTEQQEEVRAFVRVVDEKKQYTNIETAISIPDYKEVLLEQAKREMICFTAKYRTLEALETVVSAMDEII